MSRRKFCPLSADNLPNLLPIDDLLWLHDQTKVLRDLNWLRVWSLSARIRIGGSRWQGLSDV
jgi:hypothetical protein